MSTLSEVFPPSPAHRGQSLSSPLLRLTYLLGSILMISEGEPGTDNVFSVKEGKSINEVHKTQNL